MNKNWLQLHSLADKLHTIIKNFLNIFLFFNVLQAEDKKAFRKIYKAAQSSF